MAGVAFTVELQDKEAARRLEALVERMDRPIGFYKNVGEHMTEVAIPRNFVTESGPDGMPWASLRPLTIARRERRRHTPITILRATGRLAASIISQPSETGVVIGSPVEYAAVMQGGAAQGQFGAHIGRTEPSDKRPRSQDYFMPLPWGDIPGRPYLGIGSEDELKILRIAEGWLEAE